VLRLGISEQGLTEILAVAEHVNSMAALVEGFRLRPDVPRLSEGPATELAAPLDEAAPGLAADTLDQIRVWARSTLGIEHVPAFWRVLARHPRFLASTWAKNRLVLSAAELDEATKACAALAVAINARSAYLTSYLNPWVRRVVGLDDDGLVELGAAVMHYVACNTVAHGMMLEPPFTDMRAEDFRSGGRLANAPGPGSAAPSTYPSLST
jgi:alkylhydroperoxidase/carboxymuconolactone decarboxylase family protein YurZ